MDACIQKQTKYAVNARRHQPHSHLMELIMQSAASALVLLTLSVMAPELLHLQTQNISEQTTHFG